MHRQTSPTQKLITKDARKISSRSYRLTIPNLNRSYHTKRNTFANGELTPPEIVNLRAHWQIEIKFVETSGQIQSDI